MYYLLTASNAANLRHGAQLNELEIIETFKYLSGLPPADPPFEVREWRLQSVYYKNDFAYIAWLPKQITITLSAPLTNLPAEPQVWTGTVSVPSANTVESSLAHIFDVFNNDHPASYPHRSLSIGDLVTLDGRTYKCEPIGWSPYTTIMLESDEGTFVFAISNLDLDENEDLNLCCDTVATLMPGTRCHHLFTSIDAARNSRKLPPDA